MIAKKEIKIINYYSKLIYSILKEIKKYCLKLKKFKNGVKRDRTADLLNAIQALSQLSYNPIK